MRIVCVRRITVRFSRQRTSVACRQSPACSQRTFAGNVTSTAPVRSDHTGPLVGGNAMYGQPYRCPTGVGVVRPGKSCNVRPPNVHVRANQKSGVWGSRSATCNHGRQHKASHGGNAVWLGVVRSGRTCCVNTRPNHAVGEIKVGVSGKSTRLRCQLRRGGARGTKGRSRWGWSAQPTWQSMSGGGRGCGGARNAVGGGGVGLPSKEQSCRN